MLKILRTLSFEQWMAACSIVITVGLWNAQFLIALLQPEYATTFAGTIGFAKGDKTVYYSMVEQVRQGSIIVYNLFTAEFSQLGLLHPLWIVLGGVARALGMTGFEVFHAARIVLGLGAMALLYCWTRNWWEHAWQRLLLLIGLGWFGGFGAIAGSLSYSQNQREYFHALLSADLWFSEGFAYLTLFHSPLFIISQVLLVSLLWWVVVWKYSVGRSWLIAIVLGVLFLMHPFDVIAWWVMIGVWWLLQIGDRGAWTWEPWRRLWPSVVVTVGVGMYFAYLLVAEESFGAWHSQNILPAPSLYSFVTGYGLLLPLSIAGFIYVIKNIHNSTGRFLSVWYLTLPLLMYVPLGIARRLINSWGVVVVIMSVYGIAWWWEQYGQRWWDGSARVSFQTFLVVLCMIGLVITPLYQVSDSIYRIHQRLFPEFRDQDELAAVRYFKSVSGDSVILAEPFVANLIPGETARYVWFGHDVQTINFDQKSPLVWRVYTGAWNQWKYDFVTSHAITHLVWPNALGVVPDFERVYANATYSVYQVQ